MDFPLDTRWLLTDPDVLALTRDEYAGMLRVIAATWQTTDRGIMDEEQLRVWAGYSPDEWTSHRMPMMRLFRSLPRNRLVFREVRRVAEAQKERVRKARRASAAKNQMRFRRGEATAGMVVGGKPAVQELGAAAGETEKRKVAGNGGRAHGAREREPVEATGTSGLSPSAIETAALVAGVASRLGMRSGP